ncbi:hypothetical protein SteCoe_23451 [Stentor coeruleus]|uniref:Uncharacterized protein n=1 Tax=Stentor coeruleus TaxID=5963 RepID=A0A1R2BJV5_9CILI|nr:hypothetical protein SteCoe_23451 [Stentor coeruleus]
MSIPLSKDLYKQLRLECTQGESKQNEIFSQYGISLNTEEPLEYIKYLINLSVANTNIQKSILKILPSIPITEETGKFLMILSNNILADLPDHKFNYISENSNIILYTLSSINSSNDNLFEWAYFLLSKLHVKNLSHLNSLLSIDNYQILLDFIQAKLEKAWEKEENIVPDIISIEDIEFLCNYYIDDDMKTLVILNYCTREVRMLKDVVNIFVNTGLIDKIFPVLAKTSDEGSKAVILQILSNTVCELTIDKITKNLEIVLKSAELDVKQPTTREWVFVIIRRGIGLSEEFHEKLDRLYHEKA